MVSFTKKALPINYDSVGSILKSTREELGYSAQRLCRILKIRSDYLQAIEKSHFWNFFSHSISHFSTYLFFY